MEFRRVLFRSSQVAAMASSGLRSITQKMNLPPLRLTSAAPKAEIRGGEVRAMTRSNLGMSRIWVKQPAKKLPNARARCQREDLPGRKVAVQWMEMPRQFSQGGKARSGSS